MSSDASTWNHHPGARLDPPAPKLIRTLWVMTRPRNKSVTAGIYENPYGHELRVYYGQDENNIVSTELSRTDDAPLERQANVIREVLMSQGWMSAS